MVMNIWKMDTPVDELARLVLAFSTVRVLRSRTVSLMVMDFRYGVSTVDSKTANFEL